MKTHVAWGHAHKFVTWLPVGGLGLYFTWLSVLSGGAQAGVASAQMQLTAEFDRMNNLTSTPHAAAWLAAVGLLWLLVFVATSQFSQEKLTQEAIAAPSPKPTPTPNEPAPPPPAAPPTLATSPLSKLIADREALAEKARRFDKYREQVRATVAAFTATRQRLLGTEKGLVNPSFHERFNEEVLDWAGAGFPEAPKRPELLPMQPNYYHLDAQSTGFARMYDPADNVEFRGRLRTNIERMDGWVAALDRHADDYQSRLAKLSEQIRSYGQS